MGLSRKMVWFTFGCGVQFVHKDCCCVIHCLMENHTVLHCDVHLKQSCACLRHNWLQHRVELALSVPGLHVYMCERERKTELKDLAGRMCAATA